MCRRLLAVGGTERTAATSQCLSLRLGCMSLPHVIVAHKITTPQCCASAVCCCERHSQTLLTSLRIAFSYPDFLPPALVGGLRLDLQSLAKAGRFERAESFSSDGSADNLRSALKARPIVRGSEVGDTEAFWMLHDRIQTMRRELETIFKRKLAEGMEVMYVIYPEGGYYKRHLDSAAGVDMQGTGKRSVSFIIYLNPPGWDTKNGGQLRVYGDHDVRDVYPESGSVVVFDSKTNWHEVMETRKERACLVGFLHDDFDRWDELAPDSDACETAFDERRRLQVPFLPSGTRFDPGAFFGYDKPVHTLKWSGLDPAPPWEFMGLSPEAESWHSRWRKRLACWWRSLPEKTQAQVGDCFGAFGLHLGSRLDQFLGKPHWREMGDAVAEPNCEWLTTEHKLKLPSFPRVDFQFEVLMPIPRLVPDWKQFRSLGFELRSHAELVPRGFLRASTTTEGHTGGMAWGAAAGTATGAVVSLIAFLLATFHCPSRRLRLQNPGSRSRLPMAV